MAKKKAKRRPKRKSKKRPKEQMSPERRAFERLAARISELDIEIQGAHREKFALEDELKGLRDEIVSQEKLLQEGVFKLVFRMEGKILALVGRVSEFPTLSSDPIFQSNFGLVNIALSIGRRGDGPSISSDDGAMHLGGSPDSLATVIGKYGLKVDFSDIDGEIGGIENSLAAFKRIKTMMVIAEE